MIRKIERSDIPECVDVICASFMTVADEFGFTKENAPRFTAFATDEDRVLYWMCEQHHSMYGYYKDGRLVGYYNLYIPNDKEVELGSLCVLPDHRHEGIGDKLLEDAIAKARGMGAEVMKLIIVEENKVLRKWYEDHGFVHKETKKFDFFPFTCGYLEMSLEG